MLVNGLKKIQVKQKRISTTPMEILLSSYKEMLTAKLAVEVLQRKSVRQKESMKTHIEKQESKLSNLKNRSKHKKPKLALASKNISTNVKQKN